MDKVRAKSHIEKLHRIKDIGDGRGDLFRLDKNEKVDFYDEDIILKVIKKEGPTLLSKYPDQSHLYRSLSRFLNISQDKILLTNGSDAALKSIFECFIQKDDEVIMFGPTYAMASVYAKIYEASVKVKSINDNLEINLEDIYDDLNENTKLIYLANPNQPTGKSVPHEQIIDLLKKLDQRGIILALDEAYYEFLNKKVNSLALLEQFKNLIILRTFSKAFGLSGLRLGYVVSTEYIIGQLMKVKTLLDINSFALAFGKYFIDNYHLVEKNINSIKESKKFLENALKSINIEYIDSETNFVHMRFRQEDISPIYQKLKEGGFLVRISGNGAPATIENCIRITVGPIPIMEKLVSSLKDII